MSKTEVKETIKKIQPGSTDEAGNKIIHILSKGNEYCIYEIEHSDINYKLRVNIDGYTDESEKKLLDRFNKVKNKYIIAKGLLYRSSDFGMMKNRVAHILATCLQNENVSGYEFDALIDEIREEQVKLSKNRLFYYLPSLVLTILSFIVVFLIKDQLKIDILCLHMMIIIVGSLMGNSISILTNLYQINFEERDQWWFYSLMGIERVFLSLIASTISYCLIRSEFIFPQIELTEYWKIVVIVIIASFSEKLIPNLLGKVEAKFNQ